MLSMKSVKQRYVDKERICCLFGMEGREYVR